MLLQCRLQLPGKVHRRFFVFCFCLSFFFQSKCRVNEWMKVQSRVREELPHGFVLPKWQNLFSFFSFRFYLFVKINTRAFLEVIKRYPGKSIRYHLQIFRTPDISHQCSFHHKVEKIGIPRYSLLNLSWKRFCTVLRKKCINILLSLGCARFL